jgi:hypothetical protein
MFPEDEVNYVAPYEYDDETGEEGEDECRMLFYLGDYEGDDEGIFRWYDECYWNTDTWQGEVQANRSPIVDIDEPYNTRLYGMFGDLFKEPFKIWFEERYGIKVKSVTI